MSDLAGKTIKGYNFYDRIATGGFGEIYRAFQSSVGREVAIKVILPHRANQPEFIRRFEAEAQIVARLEHPHIVPLYDYWREPDRAYIVMRWLPKGSLREELKDGPLAIIQVAQILVQLASALSVAHQQGVIHRDIKPENILLDGEGNYFLTDFGIAKDLADEINVSASGTLTGTPAYLSPEQATSKPVAAQSDIYSLGVVLYEMITGKHPFPDSDPISQILHHVSDPLPSLLDTLEDLPKQLDKVIQKATAKPADKRFKDGKELVQAFYHAVRGELDEGDFVFHAPDRKFVNPYKGLRAFQEGDSENFFGREALTKELIRELKSKGKFSRFLALVGPSGSGKSSAMKAGLIPEIRMGALAGSENWFIADMQPGSNPLDELEVELFSLASDSSINIREQLERDERGLVRAAQLILPKGEAELLLVIDQFEEVFSLVEDKGARKQFLNLLYKAVTDKRSRVRILITIRADFYDRPLSIPGLGEFMRGRTSVILPLSAEEISLAIREPAKRAGVTIENNIVTKIVSDVVDQPGMLPLLQYALTELFDNHLEGAVSLKSYNSIGGVLGALGKRAEDIFLSLDEVDQKISRQIFLRLVTLGEGNEDTRRRVLRQELEGLSENNDALEAVLKEFGNARLLTFDRDPLSRQATVEVAHEALIREWARLKKWLEVSRDDVKIQRSLAAAANEWKISKEDASFLVRGVRLSQFEVWGEESDLALTHEESNFLTASKLERDRKEAEEATRLEHEKALERRSKNVLRILVGVFAIATAVALFLSNFAFNQQAAAEQNADLAATAVVGAEEERRIAEEERNLAVSREVAASSISNLEVDPELSILLALQALDFSHTLEAESALHSAIGAARIEMTLTIEAENESITYSPDGTLLASGGPDNSAILWDAVTGERLRDFKGHSNGVGHIVFSPDGTQLATASFDGTAKIWDVASGEEILSFVGHSDEIWDLVFSPDGKRLVTASIDNTAKMWDASTGEILFTYSEHSDYINRIDYSPDGEFVATASNDGSAKIWRADSGETVYTFGNNDFVASVEFSPDGSQMATGGREIIIIWDVATGKELRRIKATGIVFDLAFSPDGNHIAGATHDALGAVWDVESGNLLYLLRGHTSFLLDVEFSPDGAHIATTGYDGTARIWTTSLFGLGEHLAISGYPLSAVSYSSDGAKLLSNSIDGSGIVFDALTGQSLVAITSQPEGLNSLVFSPDGLLLASAGRDNTARIWDASSGQELFTLIGHQEAPPVGGFFPGVLDVAFHPDSVRLASGGADGQVIIWDATTGESLMKIRSHEIGITNVEFSHDGTRILSSSDEPEASGVGPNTSAKIWDSNSGELLQTVSVDRRIWGLAFSPDDSRFVTAGGGGFIFVWDSATGEQLLSLVGHSSTVSGLAYNSQGTQIASSSSDSTMKIWDALSGKLLLNLSPVNSRRIDFSPDGEILVAASGQDNVIRSYILNLERLIALAQTRVTRSLTDEECGRYLHLDFCP